MRRLLGIALILVAVPTVVVFGTGAGAGGGGGYKVRAIFDFVRAVPGEDVKVAGAKVGKIDSLDVTPDNKAAVVLDIQKAGFAPFHQDAHCTIRPQSLIGETFADCSPGSSRTPELATIGSGPGKGQHLLGVQHTSSPVDIDEINDIMREPTRERLAILISEFGTGLAGRGKDLNAAIHRANPALRDTDKVLAILARQNRTLADLARSSDRVLQPLAARRRQVADFIVQANKTAQATAERRADISGSIRRLPAFLRQLRPTLVDLGALADQSTPVFVDLHRAAQGLNRFIEELGPFSSTSIPAIRSLGHALDVGRPALVAAGPIASDLRQFATDADPLSKNLDALQKSLTATGGINRLMDYLFFQMTAINGFDGVGHYLRAGLIVNLCSTYTSSVSDPSCLATFSSRSTSSSAASASPDPTLRATHDAIARTLRGESTRAGSPGAGAGPPKETNPSTLQRLVQLADPRIKQQRKAGIDRIRSGAATGSPALGPGDPALDYLLGN